MSSLDEEKSNFDVAGYWEERYRSGRDSGSGSYNRLAKFKANYINEFIDKHAIKSAVELGCGDGSQLALINYPQYIGLDISPTVIDKCKKDFAGDDSKTFRAYNPGSYCAVKMRSELAVSLDVIYHLSNDEIYFAYLKHLFSSASRFVMIYSNSQNLYMEGVNENAQYVRFRTFDKDVEKLHPEWDLVEVEPNFYPFNPSLPDRTSIADFYIYAAKSEQHLLRSERKNNVDFAVKKLLNKSRVSDEQSDLILKEIRELNEHSLSDLREISSRVKEIERKQIDSCFEKYEKLLNESLDLKSKLATEIENYTKLEEELENKRKELSVCSEETGKRIANLEASLDFAKKHIRRIEGSARYQVGYHVVRAGKSWRGALGLPIALFRIARRRYFKKQERTGKVVAPSQHQKKLHDSHNLPNMQERIFKLITDPANRQTCSIKSIIYGDVSPNVLDGSSIWLSSITNIISSTRDTILLLKDDIKNEKVISSIEKSSRLTIIQPKDIGVSAPLSVASAAEVLSQIYSHCPQATALITRGVDIGHEVQKRKEFAGVFYPYVTDFYEVTKDGFSFVEYKTEKLKEIVLNAKAVLCQTDELRDKIEEIVGWKFDSEVLPPTIPDKITAIRCHYAQEQGLIHIGYAGKVQPRWGVEELIEEVGRQIVLGQKIKIHIATGKIRGSGNGDAGFVERLRTLLKKDFVELYEDLSRDEAISLISSMDLVWCYRDPNLEDSTLELSTKLVETAALGKPCLAYASAINEKFLGKDYPFLISGLHEVSDIIANLCSLTQQSRETIKELSEKICEKHCFSSLSRTLSQKLDEGSDLSLAGKKIVISGHDLKFIFPYVTHLRRCGAEVGIDPWEWGGHVSLEVSNYYASWADYVFCEWGLANAVWHSLNKKEGTKLFVRIHAQEVRKKAARFGHQIDVESVDRFVFVSPLIREQAQKLFDWPRSRTLLIPNAVKNNRFYGSDGELRPMLGMVGIVPTTKRLDRALDLVETMNKSGWGAKLYCKGHRPEDLPFMKAPGRQQELAYYDDLYDRIKSSPHLNGNIIFDVWGNDVEQWYNKVDFILSPSENESFHYALADGVMAGCIPLVWPWAGAEEVYCADWIVNDVEDAVKRIERVLVSDKADIQSKIARNREIVQHRYGEDQVFRDMDGLFD